MQRQSESARFRVHPFLRSNSTFSCLHLQSEHDICAHFGEQSLDSLVRTLSILNADYGGNCRSRGPESRVCCCYSPQQHFAIYFRNLDVVWSNIITALIISSFPWILSFGYNSKCPCICHTVYVHGLLSAEPTIILFQ